MTQVMTAAHRSVSGLDMNHRALVLAVAMIAACGDSKTDIDEGPLNPAGSGGGGQAGSGGEGGVTSAGAGGMLAPVGGASGTAGGVGGSAGSAGAAPTSGSGGSGGEPGGSGGSGGNAGTMSDAGTDPTSKFPSVSDLNAVGPYTATMIENSGPGGGYTVFHPQELGPDGLKNPILTWGNGATTVPSFYVLLPHLASHGFVIVASNNAFVTGEEMRAGIDWLFEQNNDSSSIFHQKLDTNVASFGYSLGSLGTFEIADDPRLVTTVHISGGAMDKAVVPNLSHPAAFFCGDPSDIAHENCESDFMLASVPVFYGVFPGDHLGILGDFAEPINKVVTGWLRWRLMHDDSLAPLFVGPDCSVCMDAGWTVKQKDFDVAP